jgi:hypothetical protein
MKFGMDCRVLALVPVLGLTGLAAPLTFYRDIAPRRRLRM